jgi:ParB family chromosome partitioning protein
MKAHDALGDFHNQPGNESGVPRGIQKIPVDLVDGDPTQPRRHFDADALSELAGSLKLHGQLQPIRVRRGAPGRWIVIAGERRLRAAKLAGITHIEATIADARLSEDAVKIESVVENLLRQDLTPLESAQSYRRLLDAWGCSMSELARRLSVATTTVTRAIKLLDAPPEAMAQLIAGGTMARALGTPSKRKQKLPRGAIGLPSGYVVVKRGATIEALVVELQQHINASRKAA